ncbi:hypothetical protein, partial [Magnetovibrio blakemorei]|uniref:hypothetical protein n=1 Tax=Magnetovibrio blakemorei TaxID=28181 RepID=UPI001112D0B4
MHIGRWKVQHLKLGSCLVTLYDSDDLDELVCVDDMFMDKGICISLIKQDDPELPYLVWKGLDDGKHIDAWLTMMRLRYSEIFEPHIKQGSGNFTDRHRVLFLWDQVIVFPVEGPVKRFYEW